MDGIDETISETEATIDDLNEGMDGLWKEFELYKRNLQWGFVLFVVIVTFMATLTVLLA